MAGLPVFRVVAANIVTHTAVIAAVSGREDYVIQAIDVMRQTSDVLVSVNCRGMTLITLNSFFIMIIMLAA
jgi:hypothetical protein